MVKKCLLYQCQIGSIFDTEKRFILIKFRDPISIPRAREKIKHYNYLNVLFI